MKPREDHVLDLRGEICPFTFARTKLRVEEIEPGEVLKVIIDYPPAVNNVIASIEREGHHVTHYTRASDSDWYVWVKKVSNPEPI